MNKYRIVRWENYDKKGELVDSYFYIEKSRKIFGRTFWTSVRENTPMGETIDRTVYKRKLKFKFVTEAQHFIEEILVQNKPYDTEKITVVEVY
jgi:hypothetical protein